MSETSRDKNRGQRSGAHSPHPTPKALNNKAQGREAHPGEPILKAKNPERVSQRRVNMRDPKPNGRRVGPFFVKPLQGVVSCWRPTVSFALRRTDTNREPKNRK